MGKKARNTSHDVTGARVTKNGRGKENEKKGVLCQGDGKKYSKGKDSRKGRTKQGPLIIRSTEVVKKLDKKDKKSRNKGGNVKIQKGNAKRQKTQGGKWVITS